MILLYWTNVGKIEVESIQYQGYGDKMYGNDGSIIHKDGTVTYEMYVASSNPLTEEEIRKAKEGKRGRND